MNKALAWGCWENSIVAISKADSERMRRLAREGKRISKIRAEDFPGLTYADVYGEVYGGGDRSAQGAKKMISNRLKAIAAAESKEERQRLAREIDDLVDYLYENHKQNQQKLQRIRTVLLD